MSLLHRRVVASTSLTSSALNQIKLPTDHHDVELMLRFTATLTAGTADATLLEDGFLNYVRSIQILADGNRSPVYDSGENLWKRAYMYSGNAPEYDITPRAQILAGGLLDYDGAASGVFTAVMTIPVRFSLLRTNQPSRTWWNVKRFTNVTVLIQTGSASQVATAGGGGGTFTLTVPTVEIHAVEKVGLIQKNGQQDIRDLLKQSFFQSTQAVQAENSFDLNRGNAHHRIFLRAEDSSNLNSDAVVGLVTYRIQGNKGQQIIRSVNWKALRADNVTHWNIQPTADAYASVPIIPNLTGFACLDLDRSGTTESVDTDPKTGVTKAELVTEGLAVGTVYGTMEEIVDRSKEAA